MLTIRPALRPVGAGRNVGIHFKISLTYIVHTPRIKNDNIV